MLVFKILDGQTLYFQLLTSFGRVVLRIIGESGLTTGSWVYISRNTKLQNHGNKSHLLVRPALSLQNHAHYAPLRSKEETELYQLAEWENRAWIRRRCDTGSLNSAMFYRFCWFTKSHHYERTIYFNSWGHYHKHMSVGKLFSLQYLLTCGRVNPFFYIMVIGSRI